jgi:hypothetical protein
MKTYFFNIIIAALLICLLNSCSKADDFLTVGEINAKKINEIINNEKPAQINAFEYVTSSAGYNAWVFTAGSGITECKIEDTFIRIDKDYFNLEKLLRFKLEYGNLLLYFSLGK